MPMSSPTQDRESMAADPALETMLVDFDGKREHPHDWPKSRQWCVMLSIGLPLTLMPLSSTIISPALGDITSELGASSKIMGSVALSIFLLTYCLGTLLLGPLSETQGRWPVLQAGNLIYLAFNLAGGFSRSMPQLLVFRLLSGFGAAASLAVGASTVADVFRPDDRGRALAVVSLGPVLGSCLGPIAGGFLTEYASWRWAFHLTSILAVVCILNTVIVGVETYPPVLLMRKKKKMIKDMGSQEKVQLRTRYEDSTESIGKLYRRTLSRPFYLLATQPIVQALALYYGFLYGLIYLLLASFSDLWTGRYGMRTSIGSLNYIGPCIGYSVGAMFCAACTNWAFRVLKARNGGVEKPELRLPMMIPAALLVPIGLFWYGWSAEYRLHWVMPDIGIALPLLGATVVFQCTNAYLLDAFTIYAASANGAVYFLRGLTAFGLPLASTPMYESLGYGWGNSVLGFAALAIGLSIPILFWRYGERLRAASSFAGHSMEMGR